MKIIKAVFLFVLLTLSFESAAGREIKNVTLTPSSAAVNSSVTLTVTVKEVNRKGSKKWRSTGYTLNDRFVCENTNNDNSSGEITKSFNITAPSSAGAYTVSVYVYGDDKCDDGKSAKYDAILNVNSPPPAVSATFLDRFTDRKYSNNDGLKEWASNWNERNDNNRPETGKITIVNNALKITGSNVSIGRQADLSAYASAILSFSYSTLTSYSDDIVYLQIRASNGSWFTLKEFVGSDSNNASGEVSIDISDYISNAVDIRFLTASGFDDDDAFYVDDFAIHTAMGGSCSDISAYNLIFHDDFSESVYQLNDTWSANDFSRTSTNVWPNDSIVTTPNEDQKIIFGINNQTLQIAGDISRSGNNEYGVVLHDVNSQGYSSNSVQEYSIETSLSVFADQNGNNDVGIVFGYQSEDDFYLLRWTKLGAGYANNDVYPGTYRNLDLLWVKDGTPTLLASQPDFYSSDPMSVRITVDTDGISICINGNDVLSYVNAQPFMHSVGLFSYDNDYRNGVQVEDFKIYCRACETEDIIGWWAMEDNLEDLVGGNHLSEIGHIDFGSSNIANTIGNNSTCKYAIMDGNSYGQVDDSGHLNSEELAVSAWVYPTSYPKDVNDINGQDNLMAISSKDENYEFHINENGELFWWWQNESSTPRSLKSTNIVPLNTWSHVAISYKAGEQKMYINGILERSSSWNEIPKQSTCDYYVGADVATPQSGDECSVIPGRTFIGELDEVRIYGRYLSESEIETDMERLRECGLVNEVDHYRITHPQTNLSCLNTSVTVEACSDTSCSPVLGSNVTGNLQYTLGASSMTIAALNLTNSNQQIDFDHTSLDTITLGLNSMSPNAGVQCFYKTGAQSSCDITYNKFGYLVTASDITSSENISDNANLTNRVTVQALEAVENNPAICKPALVGEKQVNIDFSYINHPNNYDEEKLNVSLDDTFYIAVTSGNGIIQTLDFSDPNQLAKAYFYVRYGDAGTLELSVGDPNGDVVTGYDSFNVIPNSIKLIMNDGVSPLGVTGNETHYAGQNFNLSIKALNANGNITNNYRPGNLELNSVMSSPLINNGANPVQFYYGGSSPISALNTQNWTSPSPLVFDNNGYTSAVTQFDNVGSFTVDVKDLNYLGYEINSNGATNAGRFTPAYFTFENTSSTHIDNTHDTFTYFGELLEFPTTPVFSYVAKTYSNLTATNYAFNSSNFGFLLSNYEEDTNYNPAPYPYSSIENIDLSVQGKLAFTLVSPFLYEKSVTPTKPLVSKIKLLFSTDELQDIDNVGYDSTGINNDMPIYESFTAVDNTFNLRYGRVWLENAFGNKNSDLKVEMVLQYYDINGKFITNVEDGTTTFENYIVEITEDGNASSYLSRLDGTTFKAGKTAASEGLFIVAPNTAVELDVTIINLPNYLNVDWDNDGDIDINDKVSSRVIFGSYRGNDRIIYKRER